MIIDVVCAVKPWSVEVCSSEPSVVDDYYVIPFRLSLVDHINDHSFLAFIGKPWKNEQNWICNVLCRTIKRARRLRGLKGII